MKRAIVMKPRDNVATVLDELEPGNRVTMVSVQGEMLQEITALKAVPFGHKLARYKLTKGTEIVKYGEVIGVALYDIEAGDYVHVHNVNSARLGVP